jgi:outer membrane immunogenic protein
MRKFSLFLAAGALAAVSTTAMAADIRPMPQQVPSYTPPARVTAMFDWRGFYGGLQAGGTALKGNYGVAHNTFPNLLNIAGSANDIGFIGGALAGYNWQTGQWVYGLEADINYSGANSNFNHPVFGAIGVEGDIEEKWRGGLRGRVGYALDRTHLYIAGGLSYGKFAFDGGISGLPFATPRVSWDETRWGWNIGAGVEYALDRWLARVEYRYDDFGSKSRYHAIYDTTTKFDLKSHTAFFALVGKIGHLN